MSDDQHNGMAEYSDNSDNEGNRESVMSAARQSKQFQQHQHGHISDEKLEVPEHPQQTDTHLSTEQEDHEHIPEHIKIHNYQQHEQPFHSEPLAESSNSPENKVYQISQFQQSMKPNEEHQEQIEEKNEEKEPINEVNQGEEKEKEQKNQLENQKSKSEEFPVATTEYQDEGNKEHYNREEVKPQQQKPQEKDEDEEDDSRSEERDKNQNEQPAILAQLRNKQHRESEDVPNPTNLSDDLPLQQNYEPESAEFKNEVEKPGQGSYASQSVEQPQHVYNEKQKQEQNVENVNPDKKEEAQDDYDDAAAAKKSHLEQAEQEKHQKPSNNYQQLSHPQEQLQQKSVPLAEKNVIKIEAVPIEQKNEAHKPEHKVYSSHKQNQHQLVEEVSHNQIKPVGNRDKIQINSVRSKPAAEQKPEKTGEPCKCEIY